MPGSSHSELMPGSLLGKYRIERLLGHGGMATVYLAVQEGTGLEVALKVLMFRGESSRHGGDVARFIREARLAGGIRHPHWVSVYETGFDAKNNLYYIAMERMQASLATRLRAHGPLAEPEAIAVVEQIALALEKAFETQMVHRDIKPGNILYNAAGVCKLTDFGIAKSSRNEETQLTLREAVFGTPAYMSPEQATDARKVDARSDIYSLGTVFFELLSGERPYQGETPVQVLAQVITDKPPPDVRSKPKARKVHSDTAKLIMSMMAKDPAGRPQTPMELVERLRALKARVPYARPPESPDEPPYDDSTIMDPTNPPPSSFGAVSAGTSASWSERATATVGASDSPSTDTWRDGPAPQRTIGNTPTFATQAVRDGTVATMSTRTTVPEPNPAAHPSPKRSGKAREERGGSGKGWFATLGILLVLLFGVAFWASDSEFIENHSEDPGIVGDICRWLYRGELVGKPDAPPGKEPDVVSNPETNIPEEPIVRSTPAYLRFINQGTDPVLVEAPWKFEVAPGSPISREITADSEVEIVYRPGWNEGDYEQPSPKKIKTPAAGRTNDVVLTLVRKEDPEVTLPAWVEFRNAGPETVRVKPIGSWNASEFNVQPNGKVPKPCKPGATLEYEYWTPYSPDYKRGTNTVTALPVGGTTKYETINPPRVASQAMDATLTLVNTNDVDIMVDLSGGASGIRKVKQGGVPEKILIKAGTNTIVRYYTADPRYQEDGSENAGTENVSGTTKLSLVLHPKPAPTLTVRNDGPVPLRVAITGAKSGRRDGPATIPPQQSADFRNLPVGEELNLVYTVDGNPRYRGGVKRLLGLDWGEKSSETVRAVLQNQPAMEIRNTGYRAVKVTVTHNGKVVTSLVTDDNSPVENPFNLEGKDTRILAFGEAGEYRIQTEAVIGANDPFGSKGDYNSIDRIVPCDWGSNPTLVECDANVTAGHSDMPSVTEKDGAIQGALKDASETLSKRWGAHGDPIGKIVNWLSAAKRYGTGEDVDGIVENVPGVLAYGNWKSAVENKQKTATEEKNQAVIGDERWQHIVVTTRGNGSWKEFLDNY